MTLQQFLKALSETPRQWFVDTGLVKGAIRCKPNGLRCCPMTMVAGLTGAHSLSVAQSVVVLGMDSYLGYQIADAADTQNNKKPETRELREQLLVACGLTEPSTEVPDDSSDSVHG